MSRRRYSRTRRALLVGALTLAIYPFPRFSLPAQGAPRRSLGATGRIVANEIVHPTHVSVFTFSDVPQDRGSHLSGRV